MKTVAVFCGAAFGAKPSYRAQAEALGRALALRNVGLVYGGGSVGLMGAVANATLAHGGTVTGVIPAFLHTQEIAHRGLTSLEVVSGMMPRKERMMALSDGFIALPGGLGTFDEVLEVLTFSQLDLHQKPLGLLDVDGFFQPFQGLIAHLVEQGFVRLAQAPHLPCSDDPDALLDMILG